MVSPDVLMISPDVLMKSPDVLNTPPDVLNTHYTGCKPCPAPSKILPAPSKLHPHPFAPQNSQTQESESPFPDELGAHPPLTRKSIEEGFHQIQLKPKIIPICVTKQKAMHGIQF